MDRKKVVAGAVFTISPGIAEYYMTGQLTAVIAGGVGLFLGITTYAVMSWLEKRDTRKPTITLPIQWTLLDRLAVLRNRGNHEAVSRLIVKSNSIKDIDSLFNNYINSPGHHETYEVDVEIVRYWRKCQLLEDPIELGKWYNGERERIQRRYNLTPHQFDDARKQAETIYPELTNEWRVDQQE